MLVMADGIILGHYTRTRQHMFSASDVLATDWEIGK
jgi:hypothetical protein